MCGLADRRAVDSAAPRLDPAGQREGNSGRVFALPSSDRLLWETAICLQLRVNLLRTYLSGC